MPGSKPKKPPKQAAADDLVRETAGNYVSGDGRFGVRQSDSTWYVVDRQQTNEFGQELIHGPFGSMKAAKAHMPGARAVKPLLRSRTRPQPAPQKQKQKPPKPPPQRWIDRLPRDEATEVKKLIRAVEKEGIEGADALVRRDRAGLQPAIAQALLDRRVANAIAQLPENERVVARRVLKHLGAMISAGDAPGTLPGWALFETGPGREPTKRRLRLGD